MVICLEFANTVDRRPTPAPIDRFARYADLAAWAAGAGVLPARDARALADRARRQPAASAEVMRQAARLREAIYRVISAVASRRTSRAADLDVINTAIAGAHAGSRLAPRAGGFARQWAGDRWALDRMLWPVAQSVEDLLTSAELIAVRECAAPDCGRLFVDTSRNRTRRWCDMRSCGNRAKVRRFYSRRKARKSSR
ncbi:MAG TPA: ABATE domain-containing protein [Methylomirabilota bacterium]|jgi:predicted RNA-binding Zn ribbon-like protein